MDKLLKLNLGCGTDKRKGYINVDPIPVGQTKTGQGWFFGVPLSYTGSGPVSGSYCKTDDGDQGVWSPRRGIGSWFCWRASEAIVHLDYLNDGKTDVIDVTNKWYLDTVVPGHINYSCSSVSTPTTVPKVYLTYEAEAGIEAVPMVSVRDTGVSGCYYNHSPEGSGSGKGYVELTVNIPRAAYYWVWGRVRGPSAGSNSFRVNWDQGTEVQWPISGSDSWGWEKVTNFSKEPWSWNLTAGNHRLRIRTLEDGSQIDAVGISNDFNWNPTFFQNCLPSISEIIRQYGRGDARTDLNVDGLVNGIDFSRSLP